ncbi:hypothetical protein G9A89_014226 [Geosiphon pyriformis]|nr:hypothetical protein G9A89_014226 [Geosiphon pyriformis]
MLDVLEKAKFFSTLDLESKYWQVEMNPKDSQQVQIIGDNLKLKIQLLEVQPHPENVNSQQISINNITEKRPKTSGNICNKFKVATALDITTLEKHFFNTSKIESTTTSLETITLQQLKEIFLRTYYTIPTLNQKTLVLKLALLILRNSIIISFDSVKKNILQTHNLPLNSNLNLKPVATKDIKITNLSNLLDFLAENQSEHSETAANKENNSEITEEESIDSENEEDKMTTYIAKISKFNGENIETSPQEWLDQVTKAGDANGWNAARMLKTIPYFLKRTTGEWFENLAAPFNDWNAFKAAFLEQFTNNNTSITLHNCFRNIKQEPSKSVMTYIGKFNKLLRRICQLETNNYYSDAQILDQFITEDLNSAIQYAKKYEMAMEKVNRTKLVNLAIEETSSAAEEKIDQLTKKVKNYFTNQQQQQPQKYQPPQRRNQNNFAPLSNNQPQNCHYCRISGHWKRDCRKLQQDQQNRTHSTTNPTAIPTTIHTTLSINNNRISSNNQLVSRNTTQPRPNHYHTQSSYLTMPEEQDFYHTALSEDRAAAQQQQNSSHNHTTIPPQKAITAMYTEAEVEGKTIHLILDREIDNFSFTLDGITIPVKVLVMDAPQYQALIGNDWLQKANANLNWETQKLTISYQGQHTRVPAICGTFNKRSEKALAFEFEPEEEKPIIKTFMALGSTSNWADETEQEHFTPHIKPETSGWNIPYSKPEPRKQRFYIPLKCKDYHKKLLSMGACILPEEKYENHTYNTPCLTCGDMLPEECNWIDIAIRGGVCNQTCQYALSISEKVKRGTLFNAAYNSALNKLYHYPHDAEMIFDLAMALINGATKEDVHQMKEAEYIEYTIELAGFNYEDEVKVYHQIASHTYPTQEAQIQ